MIATERVCCQCGTDISHRTAKAVYCSRRCAFAWRYANDDVVRAKHKAKTAEQHRQRREAGIKYAPAPHAIRQCAWCDHDFEYHPKIRTTFCSRTCAHNHRHWDGKAIALPWKTCACGTTFIARHRRIHCSDRCGKLAEQANRNGVAFAHYLATTRVCKCGIIIDKPRWACDACVNESDREARRRAKRRRRTTAAVTHEPYTTAEIAERDGHRCGLCHKRVAMRMVVPHPRAPTIDHILPLSEGGDDTKANVQLAHFQCNSLKSAHAHPTDQLRLVG